MLTKDVNDKDSPLLEETSYDEYVEAFKFILNEYYQVNGNDNVRVNNEMEAYYSLNDHLMVLGEPLLDLFTSAKLPRFTLFYHETGHVLFSRPAFKLTEEWIANKVYPIQFIEPYHHLMNWIEDFYIEDKMVKTFPYLQNIIQCLKLVPLDDPLSIKKVFNYYYHTGKGSPALQPADQQIFLNYINQGLMYRNNPAFGRTPLSQFGRNAVESMYIKYIKDFYDWCVSKKIFDPKNPTPTAPHPVVQYTQVPNGQGQGQGQGAAQNGNQSGNGGGHGAYTTQVGNTTYKVYIPQHSDPTILEKFKDEQGKYVMGRTSTSVSSLQGMFNNTYRNTTAITNRPIIKNFFNVNKILEGILFKKQNKVFNGCSIFRDVSGSTHGSVHEKMNDVILALKKDLPVNFKYYLYGSGDVSIIEVPFIDWSDSSNPPQEYQDDPMFQQLGGGTNSGAIANVITEQLNSKWLYILITDGDLDDLFDKDNIDALLENVFVVFVGNETNNYTDKINPDNYIVITENTDTNNIINALAKYGGL